MKHIRLLTLVIVLLVSAGCGILDSFTVPAPDSLTGEACFPTPSDMEGPYYIADAPFKDNIAPPGVSGERLIISGTVYGPGCATVYGGAIIDIWQADASGQYNFSDQYILRGRVRADENGRYQFETILPGIYEPRPRHIHLKISHPEAQLLTTQLYFEGGDNRGADPALLIPLVENSDQTLTGTFDIVLEAQ